MFLSGINGGDASSDLSLMAENYSLENYGNLSGDVKAKIAELESIYAEKAKSTSKLDGFTAVFGDWWFNVRPSGTEPKLRLNIEANSPKLRDKKKEELLKIIKP